MKIPKKGVRKTYEEPLLEIIKEKPDDIDEDKYFLLSLVP